MLRRWSKLKDRVSSRLGVRARIILALAQPSAMSGSAVAEQGDSRYKRPVPRCEELTLAPDLGGCAPRSFVTALAVASANL